MSLNNSAGSDYSSETGTHNIALASHEAWSKHKTASNSACACVALIISLISFESTSSSMLLFRLTLYEILIFDSQTIQVLVWTFCRRDDEGKRKVTRIHHFTAYHFSSARIEALSDYKYFRLRLATRWNTLFKLSGQQLEILYIAFNLLSICLPSTLFA